MAAAYKIIRQLFMPRQRKSWLAICQGFLRRTSPILYPDPNILKNGDPVFNTKALPG
jgi:hypothetical protein